jgi:hypothetical protein
MKRFVLGLVTGLALGVSLSAAAAKLVGDNGFLIGWEVTVDGEVVCDSPYIWVSLLEIECD